MEFYRHSSTDDHPPAERLRLIRLPEVLEKTGECTSVVYEKQAKGLFPRSVPLGPRSVAWVEAEVDQYIRGRIAERDQRAARSDAPIKRERLSIL